MFFKITLSNRLIHTPYKYPAHSCENYQISATRALYRTRYDVIDTRSRSSCAPPPPPSEKTCGTSIEKLSTSLNGSTSARAPLRPAFRWETRSDRSRDASHSGFSLGTSPLSNLIIAKSEFRKRSRRRQSQWPLLKDILTRDLYSAECLNSWSLWTKMSSWMILRISVCVFRQIFWLLFAASSISSLWSVKSNRSWFLIWICSSHWRSYVKPHGEVIRWCFIKRRMIRRRREKDCYHAKVFLCVVWPWWNSNRGLFELNAIVKMVIITCRRVPGL